MDISPSEDRGGRWLWLTVMLLTVALVAHTAVGLVLAMAGSYSTWVVAPITIVATAATWPWLTRAVPTHRATARLPAIAMIAFAGGMLIYSSVNVGEHLFIRRDPGSYMTTARWLADNGNLRVDVFDPVLAQVPEVSWASAAVFEVEPGIVEFQFSHGASIWMATAFDIAGADGLFVSSAMVGALALLAVYLALTTVTRSGWLAFAGAASFGISLPVLFATRTTYSEPFVLLLMMLALAVLLADGRHLGRSQLAFVGMLIGATTLFRIDAQLYVIGLLALASVLMLRGTHPIDAGTMLAAAAVPVVVGAIDVRAFAGTYARDLADNVALLDRASLILVIVAIGVAVWVRTRGPSTFFGGGSPRLASWAAASVAVLGVVAWQVRPHIWPAAASWSPQNPYAIAVVGLQSRVGIDADPSRSYSELSVEAISWYLGAPLVALAIVGFAFVTYRLFAERSTRLLPAAVLVLVGVPVYLYDINITPDQLWATRRFVPFVLPCFVVGAVWAAERCRRATSTRANARTAVLVVLAASLMLPAAAATWPIRALGEQRGAHDAIDSLCSELGADALVLDLANGLFSMPTRAWCGASAARVSGDAAVSVPAFAEISREECTRSFVIAEQRAQLEPFIDDIAIETDFSAVNSQLADATLIAPPDRYVDQSITWALARVPLPDDCSD